MTGPPKREREPARAPVGHRSENQRQADRYQNPLLPAIIMGERLRVIVVAFELRVAAVFAVRKAVPYV